MTSTYKRSLLLALGPLLAALVYYLVQDVGMTLASKKTLAITTWMVWWWVTNVISISVTALLPLLLFPAFGVMAPSQVAHAYSSHLIFLLLGAAMIALAMQETNFHKRIALSIVKIVGVNPQLTILGFMLATAVLSMWVSNTATALMMIPIALSLLDEQSGNSARNENYTVCLLLGIAYGASIGGVATIIGTGTNTAMVGLVDQILQIKITFIKWFLFAFPLVCIMLPISWLLLTRFLYPIHLSDARPFSSSTIAQKQKELGSMSRDEKVVAITCLCVAIAWSIRPIIAQGPLAMVGDSTIAMAGAIFLFAFPSSQKPEQSILDWNNAKLLPWGVILLLGGGFALSAGFLESGLTEWLANSLGFLVELPFWAFLMITITLTTCLTELTSNVATASILIPLVAKISALAGVDPMILIAAVSMASSYAFMLPVATPPNAVIFNVPTIKLYHMLKAGIILNLIGIVLIGLFVTFFMPSFH